MRYLKTYEGVKFATNKFKKDDYVFLVSDYVNGTEIQNISKRLFRINDIEENPRYSNKRKFIFIYSLYVNNDFFFWVYENALRLATETEIDAIKYNL